MYKTRHDDTVHRAVHVSYRFWQPWHSHCQGSLNKLQTNMPSPYPHPRGVLHLFVSLCVSSLFVNGKYACSPHWNKLQKTASQTQRINGQNRMCTSTDNIQEAQVLARCLSPLGKTAILAVLISLALRKAYARKGNNATGSVNTMKMYHACV